MKTSNEHQDIDALVKKYIQELPNEKPSIDFTRAVMDQVTELPLAYSVASQYEPLISKRMWTLIVSTVILVLGYLFFSNGALDFSGLASVFVEGFEGVDFPSLSMEFSLFDWSLSTTGLYACMFLTGMFMIQIGLMKGLFEKDLNA